MTEKQFRWFVGCLVVFAAFLAYANTFANDFVWDDASSVLIHEHVQDPGKIAQLFMEDQHAFGRGAGNFYRPLVSVSFMLDFWLSRPGPTMTSLSPFLFHVTNTVWHCAAALLVFAMLTVFNAPRFVRLVGPLLYVVHPLHTEAVSYISGRADSMATAFVLLAICCVYNSRVKYPVLWGSLAFIGGLLSKESATILPFLLVWAAIAFRRNESNSDEPRRKPGTSIAAAGALLGAYVAFRLTVLRFGVGAETVASPFGRRLAEAGQAFALYIKLMFVPTELHMERTLAGVPTWLAVLGWALIVGFVLLTIAALALKKGRLAFALGLFLITWFPISGLFPLNAPMAEHWMYLPMTGFVWALLELLWLVVARNPLRYAAYAASYGACLVLVMLTVDRNHDWRTNESIYLATLQKNPQSIRVQFNLGVTYEDISRNLSGARRHFEQVLALYADRKAAKGELGDVFYEDEMEAHLSLGEIYAQENRPDQAAAHLETLRNLIVTESNTALIGQAYVDYAQLLLAAGRPEDARKLLKEGTDKVPGLKQQFDSVLRRQSPAASQTTTAPAIPEAPLSEPNIPPQTE